MPNNLEASEELKRRAQVLLGKNIHFIHDPCFNLPNAASFIMVFGALGGDGEYVDEMPLLTREKEGLLFRQLNFTKRQAQAQQRKINLEDLCWDVIDETEWWFGVAEQTRNRVIVSNQRLIKSVARRFTNPFCPGRQFDDLVSEGNMILFRAVEKFDWRRGNKFSTYARVALIKSFSGHGLRMARIRKKERPTDRVVLSNVVEQDGTGDRRYWNTLKALRALGPTVLYEFDDRERLIISAELGFLEGRPSSMRALGKICGFSGQTMCKVRIRCLEKLLRAAKRLGIEPP